MLMTSLVSVVEGTTDEFDISADTAKVSELGIPTTSPVAELKKKADELWNAGDYQEAAEAYSIYAKNANWLANLIQAGCEPFYDGTKDKRSDFYSAIKGGFYTTVSTGESKANGYKSEYWELCTNALSDIVGLKK